jgi:hypothetical protein
VSWTHRLAEPSRPPAHPAATPGTTKVTRAEAQGLLSQGPGGVLASCWEGAVLSTQLLTAGASSVTITDK